ncbi:MAG TPA: transglutaminase family protein [Polyangiales bacterium]|nr:transglutaminase family protein [Polyangiales bacterium]
MLIRAGYEISLFCEQETPLLALLSVHPSRSQDLRTADMIRASNNHPLTTTLDEFGNWRTRTIAPAGLLTLTNDFVISDSGKHDFIDTSAKQIAVGELPDAALQFLKASRYCESDKLSELAWSLFGTTPPGHARVQAICDYAHNRLKFNYQDASQDRTAFGANEERIGVCRDFAHLGIALCRAMNIPARYCTGYMGDIGVPLVPPMDFSAWIEVYLDHRWFTFDPRNNIPRIGRVVMAHGRDAADVAITTTYGPSKLVGFKVHTDPVETLHVKAA